MELINSTRLLAGSILATDSKARELLVVVVKGTFRMPINGEPVKLAEEQVPLVSADTFTGQPGFSAPIYETDYAPRKHRCDVLLIGSAYAPGGRPATRVSVGMRVGTVAKSFDVVGDRQWQWRPTGIAASSPASFVSIPISYDVAFGGNDQRYSDSGTHGAFLRNPVGRGFHKALKKEWVDSAPLPNTEATGHSVDRPDSETFMPMSFGAIGRGWQPRAGFAGTYDDKWLRDCFPFLPPDFDERFFQSAPSDQQMECPSGGETVRLVNLTPGGLVEFALPTFDARVGIIPKKGPSEELKLSLDTIVLEPDKERFSLTWRTARPLKRSVFEIGQVLVGRRSPARAAAAAVEEA